MFEKIYFLKSVYDLGSLPKPEFPQLVLCGRSNVGKSSFINSLFNKKDLAKTSSTPGKTRSINFYNVDDSFFIVDLPGFGYAKISLKEREKWGKLISKYILESENIHHAFHLIDSRYNPMDLDIQLNQWLRTANKKYTVILSKVDKLNQSQIHRCITTTLAFFPELELNKNFFLFSSVSGKWKKPVQKRIAELFY